MTAAVIPFTGPPAIGSWWRERGTDARVMVYAVDDVAVFINDGTDIYVVGRQAFVGGFVVAQAQEPEDFSMITRIP
jgi:hypothetical protein